MPWARGGVRSAAEAVPLMAKSFEMLAAHREVDDHGAVHTGSADVEVRRRGAHRHVVDVNAIGHDLRGRVERHGAGADRAGGHAGVFVAAVKGRGEVEGLGLGLRGNEQDEQARNCQRKCTSHLYHSFERPELQWRAGM